jgi:hypothetical protein
MAGSTLCGPNGEGGRQYECCIAKKFFSHFSVMTKGLTSAGTAWPLFYQDPRKVVFAGIFREYEHK